MLEVLPETEPRRAKRALTNFSVHLRDRARHEGNVTLSAALSAFAAQAEELRAQEAPSMFSPDLQAGYNYRRCSSDFGSRLSPTEFEHQASSIRPRLQAAGASPSV